LKICSGAKQLCNLLVLTFHCKNKPFHCNIKRCHFVIVYFEYICTCLDQHSYACHGSLTNCQVKGSVSVTKFGKVHVRTGMYERHDSCGVTGFSGDAHRRAVLALRV